MIKKFTPWLNIALLGIILIIPGLVFGAQETQIDRLNSAAKENGPYAAEANVDTLAEQLGLVISVALSLLGVIFIVIVILAGFKWMTAQGAEDEVKKATESIRRAIIGLVVVLSSYAIWAFIKKFFITQI